MKRLCFLLPNADSAHGVVEDLRKNGFHDSLIHVFANESTKLQDLPEAGPADTSDFYPQLQRGMAMGGSLGAIGGLIAMRVAGGIFGGGAVLLFALIGAGINGLLAAMAGAAFPNSRLREFETAIEAGHVLVMVDVTAEELPVVERIVLTQHPEVEIETFEPHTPIVPRSP